MTDASWSRRAFLASAASVTVAGCNGIRYRDRYSPGERVSLTVSAPPADDDSAATAIARSLTDRLSALGVQASLDPKGQSQLFLDAIINHDFDVFVARHPGLRHPDALYSLLHSEFAPQPGWQNPFGLTSVAIDDTLEALRADNSTEALAKFLEIYVERVPFSVIASPEFLTARRQELTVAEAAVTERPLDVLEQLADASLDRPFRVGIFSAEVTENRNPIAGEFRWNSQLLGLLYDSLARQPRDDDSLLPWAAREWFFEDGELVVELRTDQQFHDGSSLTAEDVAFTHEFLSDTSLGDASSPVPATRFRGRTTLASSARATDGATVRFDLESGVDRGIAERLLTLPILPESEWRNRTEMVEDRVTQALVSENRKAVGSGPMAFESATEKESVTLRPFEDHFLATVEEEPAARYGDALDSQGVVARYAPSGEDAIGALTDDRLDTSLHLFPVTAFGEATDTDGVVTASTQSSGLCIAGYNARRSPLSDFRFRQVLARLHDRAHTVGTVFDNYASPSDLPVLESWGHDDDAFEAYSVGSFPGSGGELDVEQARSLFEDAGYTYDDEGNLFR